MNDDDIHTFTVYIEKRYEKLFKMRNKEIIDF